MAVLVRSMSADNSKVTLLYVGAWSVCSPPGGTIISASFQGNSLGRVIRDIHGYVCDSARQLRLTARLRLISLAVSGLISGIPTGTTNTLTFNDASSVAQVKQILAATEWLYIDG